MDRVRPDRVGALQVEEELGNYRYRLHQGARVFEYATLAFDAVYQLGPALDYLAQVGLERIGKHTIALAQQLRSGLVERGFRVLTPPQNASSIVSFVHGGDPKTVRGIMEENEIQFAAELAPRRPTATFSIVARDPATGELGIGVQSHWFSVGSSVSWAEAGVGAVATQSFIEPAYGPRGLALMKAGKSASAALEELLSTDDAKDVRQVAFIDARGRVAAHTGKMCIPFAGDRTEKTTPRRGIC